MVAYSRVSWEVVSESSRGGWESLLVCWQLWLP